MNKNERNEERNAAVVAMVEWGCTLCTRMTRARSLQMVNIYWPFILKCGNMLSVLPGMCASNMDWNQRNIYFGGSWFRLATRNGKSCLAQHNVRIKRIYGAWVWARLCERKRLRQKCMNEMELRVSLCKKSQSFPEFPKAVSGTRFTSTSCTMHVYEKGQIDCH